MEGIQKPETLFIDFDEFSLEWTHLRANTGVTLTLQDLPAPLKKRVKSLLTRLEPISEAATQIQLSTNGGPAITCSNTGVQEILQEEWLLQTTFDMLWWLVYSRAKRYARQGKWRCPDCRDEVKITKDHCSNADCVSWNFLHACTGKATLRPVANSA